MRVQIIFLLFVALLFVGCTATMADYRSSEAMTLQLPAGQSRSLDIPQRFFDEILPKRFQHKGIGIINDQSIFQKMWDLYAHESTALPPSIDFQDYALLFVYDSEHYNMVTIKGINIWEGIANPFVERTNWQLPIGGDSMMRKIRTEEGATLPAPKVNVAFLQIPRNRPGKPGVTAVLVNGDLEDVAHSLVIPVPESP